MATGNAKATGCAKCLEMQQRYQQNPRSLLLRVWKWHTTWCPGWRAVREAERKAAATPPSPQEYRFQHQAVRQGPDLL